MPHTRRTFLQASAAPWITGFAQTDAAGATKTVQTSVLTIAYEDSGRGFPIILLHGFPDDVRAFDAVTPPLVKAGYRVLVPYLRGYGPTRFRDSSAPRMGEQAAIGQDLVDFVDALKIPQFAVAGYDWGCRAACIAAALHPDRVRAAVLIGGYTIQDVFAAPRPAAPEVERALSGTSTPNAVEPVSRQIGAACAGSCGNCGRPPGISATKHTTVQPRRSTIPISSK
jgi:pimeloyl-ACP methyl ester carboxylesterase